MDSLIAAYLIAALAVCGYVGRLAIERRMLARRLNELQTAVEKSEGALHIHSKAA